MKKLLLLILPAMAVLVACNQKSAQQQAQPAPAPAAVAAPPQTAAQLAAKFENSPVRQQQVARGASDYIDSSFANELFTVKDTISKIGVDNGGSPYIMFGNMSGTNMYAVKCSAGDNKDFEKLAVGQVVQVSATQHDALVKKIDAPGVPAGMHVIVVRMQNCKLAM